ARGDPGIGLAAGDAVEPGDVAQVLARAELVVETDLIGQIADAGLHAERAASRIEPEHAHAPRRRLGEPEQHQDRRRLAGAVRAEQPEHLAAPDGQIKRIYGHELAVALTQALGL